MNKHFFSAAVLLLSAALASAEPVPEGKDLPNIVIILADDLGYGDVSFLNAESKIKTPHMDSLAREGMCFTDAHTASSVCTPSRYGLLTGRYPWRSSLKGAVLFPWDEPLIESDRLTLPKMLRSYGYHTACVGKWHLGFEWPWKDGVKPSSNLIRRNAASIATIEMFDFSHPTQGGPLGAGFDYYYGVDVPNFPPYAFIENDRLLCDNPVTLHPNDMPSIGERGSIHGTGPGEKGWQFERVMPALTKRAVEYIHDQSEKPFFLYFTPISPHTPVVPSADFLGKSGVGYYGDYVLETDDAVGQVVQALKDTGQFGNTLLIVSSDNGPESFTYQLIPDYGHASMGSLRGTKKDSWEGGHRVPCIISWPAGGIPSGARSDALIGLHDLFATIAAVVGYTLPADAAEDSENLLEAFYGKGAGRSEIVYSTSSRRLGLREGSWVYLKGGGCGVQKLNEPESFRQLRGIEMPQPGDQLFNLETDPVETVNLLSQYPEKVKELSERLREIEKSGHTRHVE